MRERVTVVTVSLSLEKAPFSGFKNYILGLNVALFENRRYFGEKASGTSVVTCSDLRGHRPVIKRFST